MDHMLELVHLQNEITIKKAKEELRLCNEFSEQYGLRLSEEEIEDLIICRKNALKDSGRVEFGGGILPKLIYAFCDSPFIEQDMYEETLAELQEAFYYYKSVSADRYTDDELIEFMVHVFNGRAQGSAEYLIGTSLRNLLKYQEEDYDQYDIYGAGDTF